MNHPSFLVICSKCDCVAGTVLEVEDPKRVGFYANVCKPDPMPTVCSQCNSALIRVGGK